MPNNQLRAAPAQNTGTEPKQDWDLDPGSYRISATEEDLGLLLSEDSEFLLAIKDREAQLERFQALDKTSVCGRADMSSRKIGKAVPSCDSYSLTGFPSSANRITLRGGIPTNGAYLWDKLILIQGPRDFDQVEQLWRIAAEMQAGAIVRLDR